MMRKPINEFENYEIDTDGIIYLNNAPIKTTHDGRGYLKVFLRRDGKTYSKKIHRLVAEAFLSDWDPNLIVDHEDNNKHNNKLYNLKMLTQKQNITKRFQEQAKRGKIKITVKFDNKRKKPKQFDSVNSAAKKLNLDGRGIYVAIETGKSFCGCVFIEVTE